MSQLRDTREPFWPAAIVAFGLSLSVSWIILLGYGLVRLAEYTM